MMRYEPPRLATWMLEHLAPGTQNEALAGDLLEDFRAGRSNRWYWRQVFAACLTAWLRYLGDRKMVVAFAAVWSMLAPVWTTLQARVLHDSGHMWRMDLSFTGISTVAVWLTLNVSFLWAGVLFYFASHPNFTKRFTRQQVARAFLLAAFAFLPVYITTFVVTNIYFYPGPQVDRSTMTLLGEFMDVRLWANSIRIPFLVTLLCALWQAIPRSQKVPATPAMQSRSASMSLIDGMVLDSSSDELSVKQCFVLVVAAGLLNSLITAYLLCRLPESHAPSLTSLFVRAVIYVLFGLVGGAVGAWLYWNRPSSPFRVNPPVSFGLFALIGAATWVWAPPAMLLSLQSSPVAPFIAVVGVVLLTTSLRGIASVVLAPAQPALSFGYGNGDLFATALYKPPVETHGFVIALCIYASGYALFHGFTFASSAFGAAGTFLFAWKWGFAPKETFDGNAERERAVLRLAIVALPAVFVTLWAMLDNAHYHNEFGSIGTLANVLAKKNVKVKSLASLPGYGYESVILLPPPAKKELIFPFSTPGSLTAPEKSRPLVIHFDGPYWYLQPPDIRPGPMAHKAHGTPLSINIKSNNSLPLMMQAHQSLGASIPLARCREIQIEIENRDNQSAAIAMAILLTDSTLPGKPTFSLGQKSLASLSSTGSAPDHETLSFSVPAHASFRKFDQITISLFPDMRHALVAPKVAIEQFEIFPR